MRRLCFVSGGWKTWLMAVVCGAFGVRLAGQTTGFGSGFQIGQIQASNLTGLSGIVASRNNPGVLWVHNDRAHPDVYAVSTNGQLLATWSLSAQVSDFEDIAIGPGPVPELQYLYCGDIGDNDSIRPNIQVFRAGEPSAYPYQAAHPRTQNLPLVEKFTLQYPDGSHNAEALLVDPWTGDLFVATKESGRSRIYSARSAQLQPDAIVTLALVTEVDFNVVSAGDISPDGTEILLRQENYAKTWARTSGQSIAQALGSTPADVPVIGEPVEPNGEGVGYAADGQGYYTVSEGLNPAIYYFPRLALPLAEGPRTLLAPASAWRYKDDGSNQGVTWRNAAFDDSAWAAGSAQFGYGEDDEQTRISYGSDKDHKYVTSYFRTTFQVADPRLIDSLVLKVLFDDGVAVYLNGTEVLRRNLPNEALFTQTALVSGGAYENLWQTFSLANPLHPGTNTLAVEVHRHSHSEGDLSFDLQLLGMPKPAAAQFTGPPSPRENSAWVLGFQAAGAASVTLETSLDLANWTTQATATPANGVGSFTLLSCPAPFSFYRLRR